MMLVSRVVQRTIAYLGTMTGAGVAYAVDTRLRPSGQQGTLVTSFDAFERYQQERAELWEHLALMRARAIGGESARSDRVLEGVRGALFRARPTPWRYVADVRGRIEQERAREGAAAIDLKTGSGGLVDVEFLAQAGMLERGHERVFPPVPSIPALLRSAQSGPNVDRLLEQYAFLRRVEARARWLAGRGVDRLTRDSGDLAALAELVETGWSGERLWERVASAREAVRAAFVRVIEAETIRALDG